MIDLSDTPTSLLKRASYIGGIPLADCGNIFRLLQNSVRLNPHLSDIIYGLITSNDLSNRTTALLDINVHIKLMPCTPQDQLRAYADFRRKQTSMNDAQVQRFPIDFGMDAIVLPAANNHSCQPNNRINISSMPPLNDFFKSELTARIPFSLDGKPLLLAPPSGEPTGVQDNTTTFDQLEFGRETDGDFEMWSTMPSGNEFVHSDALCQISYTEFIR